MRRASGARVARLAEARVGGAARPDLRRCATIDEADLILDAPGYAEMLDAVFTRYDLNRDGIVAADECTDPIQR